MKTWNHLQIRNEFLNYFAKNSHEIVASSSLVPVDDPTLLFTNAGMNQFKDTFLGTDPRPYLRAVSAQKCVRAGGKHNDLDNVGFTARHHTFFEMLGNFSFGDYFKKEAIHFAWEFLTKNLALDPKRLYITVHLTDDEAAEIWHRQEGIPKDRIFRFDKDNFWRMGETGPCGPSTEIFYDHGPAAGLENDPFKGIELGQDRFVEIWNLVFMQFFERAPGDMIPLPKPSVDTGSGLERVTAALQGVRNNYQTDLFMGLIHRACKTLNREYGEFERPAMSEQLVALRVLADHVRSSCFLLADGVHASNEGRGYVLRRILRRAIRFGRKLTEQDSLLLPMADELIAGMGQVYPELLARKSEIISALKDEEARFLVTLDRGMGLLNDEVKKIKSASRSTVPGDLVFKLYDTFGFPADLTALIAAENNLQVDEVAFQAQMEAAKEKARASWKGSALGKNHTHLSTLMQKYPSPTKFLGYETLTVMEAKIVGLSNGESEVTSLAAGEQGWLVSDKTPFYAEGGGQIGDRGFIKTNQGLAKVFDTIKIKDVFFHHIEVTMGNLNVSASAQFTVDSSRSMTAANHSATHLMHQALRTVLGSHVAQAGSLVTSEKLRFDFSHSAPLSQGELRKIEELVNHEIAKAQKVVTHTGSYQEAVDRGALALFGEKYGDEVRSLQIGFSHELCGGTHVANTSEIRAFKILSESGVSQGVRRIEATTHSHALQLLNEAFEELKDLKATTQLSSASQIKELLLRLKEENTELQKELRKLKAANTVSATDLIATKSIGLTGAKSTAWQLVFAAVNVDDAKLLAEVSDQVRDKLGTKAIVVLQGELSETGTYPTLISLSKDMAGELHAGQLFKKLGECFGGRGGGRPDFAQGALGKSLETPEARELWLASLNLL